MEMITVILENFSSFQNTFEIFDVICNNSMQPIVFDPWESVELQICSNGTTGDGHGHIQYKATESPSWVEKALISDGETVRLAK